VRMSYMSALEHTRKVLRGKRKSLCMCIRQKDLTQEAKTADGAINAKP